MRNSWCRYRPPPRDRSGVALPVTLFGLLVVSVLIVGVLLTSSTEAVLSFAHRDATAHLYAAEGAVQAYVASQNTLIQPASNKPWLAPGSPASDSVRLRIERLADFDVEAGAQESHAVYSIQAEPLRGGRGVTAFIRVVQQMLGDFNADIDAALTLGGDARIAGGTKSGVDWKISNGGDAPGSDGCSPADSANHAIVYASDADVSIQGQARGKIRGDSAQAAAERDALIRSVLGGASIRDLAWNADIKFGSYFNEPPYTKQHVISGNSNRKYDWGCPGRMDQVKHCYNAAGYDSTYYPVVAIDAENTTINVSNWHGQGMLIVINGSLLIDGQFLYRGIVIAERNVIIQGGGQIPPAIEGAVIAAGQMIVDSELTGDPDDSESAGHATIRFNRCAINAVVDAFNGTGTERWGRPTVRGRTFAWSEVIR